MNLNKATVLVYILFKSGIDEATANSTDVDLIEQASALRQEPGFEYTDYKTCNK
jgi:hypothetical protein